MGYFAQAGALLLEVIFGLAVLLFALRVLLQLVRANFHNPICQFAYRATNPLLMPLRRVMKPWRSFDVAGALVVYLLECAKVWLLVALAGRALGPLSTLVLGLAESLAFLIWFFFVALLIRVVLSWVQPTGYNPVVPLLMQLTDPLLRPLRRRLPTPGGFDFAPLVVSVLLMLCLPLVVRPLQDLGAMLALGG